MNSFYMSVSSILPYNILAHSSGIAISQAATTTFPPLIPCLRLRVAWQQCFRYQSHMLKFPRRDRQTPTRSKHGEGERGRNSAARAS